ncbi:hypothetical protein BJ508DRAFT_315232 [Ascobolus immersus RN42]|uniref:Ty3 transposon capsid-like protein domain-containing protein n=1 Tax=Ascobolus immersus RN42 TaxID=1160509 RepID=A0A3N4HBN0_ASCIM|nr:hypothetical protein BJ508DRAFT_315232 [Ascobolus immersus RN42]
MGDTGDSTGFPEAPGGYPPSLTSTPLSAPGMKRVHSAPAKAESETPPRFTPGDPSPSGSSARRREKQPAKPVSDYYDNAPFVLTTSRIPRTPVPRPARARDAEKGLLDTLCASNEALHAALLQDLLHYNEVASSVSSQGINVVDALNTRLDQAREWAQHCKRTIRQLLHQLEAEEAAHTATKSQVPPSPAPLRDDETSDDDVPIRPAGRAQHLPVPTVRIQPAYDPTRSPMTPQYVVMQSPSHPEIGDIPKTLTIPLQANPIPNYNGSGDVESIFNFIRALEHHMRLLSHFTDLQRINYASSYLQGSVSQWAADWHIRRPVGTWQRFIREFKEEWLPSTAKWYLGNKLQTMVLKNAAHIDQFNFDFQSTLELLDYKDMTIIDEGHPYYALYLSKINNPSILLAIQQQAHQYGLKNEPFNLPMVMRYASRLFAAKALQGAAPSITKPVTRAALPARRAQPAIRAIDISDADSQAEDPLADSVELHVAQQRYAPPGYTRRCHLCMALNHLMRECPLKPGLEQLRRTQQSKSNEPAVKKGKD